MAKKICYQCRSEVDLLASICPHCRTKLGGVGSGGVAKRYTSPTTWGCGVIGGLFLIGFIISAVSSSESQPSKPDPLLIAPDNKTQQDRENFINKDLMGKLKIFKRVEIRNPRLIRAYVGPGFFVADIKQKESFCNVLWAYHFQGKEKNGILVLHNNQTGKELGDYTPGLGLSLKD